jgi:uncharacterized membrane protein (DUF441 family)
MDPIGRIVLGAFAAFISWTLIRALRSGKIFSRGVGYDTNERPLMFAFVAASHVLAVCFFGWLAAGGDIAAFWRLVLPHSRFGP